MPAVLEHPVIFKLNDKLIGVGNIGNTLAPALSHTTLIDTSHKISIVYITDIGDVSKAKLSAQPSGSTLLNVTAH